MRRHADDTLSIALCASLIIHVAVMFAAYESRTRELEPQLTHPAWSPEERQLLAQARSTAAPLLRPAPPEPPLPQLDPPEPEVTKPQTKSPVPEPAKPYIPPNSEWGEPDAEGIAINSAPGDQPLSAPRGPADQSFGSRDPKGPATEFPPDPSMSTIPQGDSGDGNRSLDNAIAAQEPEAPHLIMLPKPPPPSTPPAVALNVPQPAIGSTPSLRTNEPTSITPPAPREAPAPTPAASTTAQLLPQGNPDLIAIPDPTLWPAIAQALTAPPHTGAGAQATARVPLAPQLPDLATPTLPEEPLDAIASLIPPTEPQDPSDFPTIVEALLHPPGLENTEGAAATLPDLITPATPGSPDTHDAIVAMLPQDPVPDLALPIQDRAPVPPSDHTLTLNAIPTVLVPTPPAAFAAHATGAAPGPPVPPADPAADTGLESDPFAKVPGVHFRNGRVDARSGRQVKPVRPRLTEAARRDLLSLQFPTILLKVRIDPAGKVQDVKVVRGSGSEAIDMPVYRAMWQWWFEPPKDPQGNPQPDTQLVAIHWG